MAQRSSHKLACHFYGPFLILERIGAVAYKLQLPPTAKLRNAFHVSKLKKFVGNPNMEHHVLPDEFLGQHPLREPKQFLKSEKY